MASNPPLVEIYASRTKAGGPIWPYTEYLGFEDLCLRWSGRGLLLQRPPFLRFERIAERQ